MKTPCIVSSVLLIYERREIIMIYNIPMLITQLTCRQIPHPPLCSTLMSSILAISGTEWANRDSMSF